MDDAEDLLADEIARLVELRQLRDRLLISTKSSMVIVVMASLPLQITPNARPARSNALIARPMSCGV
jgi:hypothetical protein